MTNESMAASDTEISTTDVSTDDSLQPDTSADVESQGQSGEDSFFDPNSLSEELLPAYKQMQGAWTKKTQELAQQRKEVEAYKAKADAFSRYEQYIPVLDEMLAPKQPQSSPELVALESQLKGAGYSDEAIEMMKMGAQFTLNQFNQTRQQEAEQTRVSSQVEQAEKLDSRLNDPNLIYSLPDGSQSTFAEIVAGITQSQPNWNRDIVSATKRSIQIVDAMVNSAKVDGKRELSEAAKAKGVRFSPTNSSPQGAAQSGSNMTMAQAAEAARKQLGM